MSVSATHGGHKKLNLTDKM